MTEIAVKELQKIRMAESLDWGDRSQRTMTCWRAWCGTRRQL